MSVFLSKYMSMDLTTNIFNIVYNKTDLTAMNPFYVELLSAWDIVTEGKRHFHLDINDILLEPLFNNPHIKYKEKLLIFNSFIDSGIITVADIAYEVIPVLAIIEIIHKTYPTIDKSHISLAYAVILHSLPEEWKATIKSMDKNSEHQNYLYLETDNENINVSKFNVKLIYNMISKCFKMPTSIEKWNSLGYNIAWKPVWKAITYPDKSPEFIELDYKIAHNIIFTYKKLYKYNKATSKLCPVCMNVEEDLCHLFLYCDELQDLISILHELCIGIFQKTGFSLQQLKELLLFGCHIQIQNCSTEFFNTVLSIYRTTVFKRRTIVAANGKNINLVRCFNFYLRKFFEILLNQYRYQNRKSVFELKYIKNNKYLDLEDNILVFKYPLVNR